MTRVIAIKTKRLLMRQWTKDDIIDFALLNSDPEVMKYLPKILNKEESDNLADKIINLLSVNGWGFWAVEKADDNSFIGFVGLNEPKYELPVKPCVEIGWRLSRRYWGNGYATEAGNASLEFAFMTLKLKNVYSFTSVANIKSESVMKRLKLTNNSANFDHPSIPEDSQYREHVLYGIKKETWKKNQE